MAQEHKSGNSGNCVEVADAVPVVLVRDTKDRDGGALALTPRRGRSFTDGLEVGRRKPGGLGRGIAPGRFALPGRADIREGKRPDGERLPAVAGAVSSVPKLPLARPARRGPG